MPVECSSCGQPLDAAHDGAAGRRNPCPNCGSLARTITASMGEGRFSNYSLDTFIAHRLSELTECSAPPLEQDAKWLNTFILNCAFRVQLPAKTRAYIFNFIRRVEGASSAYDAVLVSIRKYLDTPRNVVSPYFNALSHLEICVSQCYQALELLSRASGQPIYAAGDGSPEELLQIIYVDSKHMDRMIDGDKLPEEATSGVWITNDGVSSARGSLSFVELHQLLISMHSLAEKLSALALNSGEKAQ